MVTTRSRHVGNVGTSVQHTCNMATQQVLRVYDSHNFNSKGRCRYCRSPRRFWTSSISIKIKPRAQTLPKDPESGSISGRVPATASSVASSCRQPLHTYVCIYIYIHTHNNNNSNNNNNTNTNTTTNNDNHSNNNNN